MKQQKLSSISVNSNEGQILFEYHTKKILLKLEPLVAKPNYCTEFFIKTLVANVSYSKTILDVGTGTGIIGIALGLLMPDITGVLVDKNPVAVSVARYNVVMNGLQNRLIVLEGDKFNVIKNQTFDLIIANLPFTPTPYEDILAHTPEDKLNILNTSGGEDGRQAIDSFIKEVRFFLTEAGTAYFIQPDYIGVQSTLELATNNLLMAKISNTYTRPLGELGTLYKNHIEEKWGQKFPVNEMGQPLQKLVVIQLKHK